MADSDETSSTSGHPVNSEAFARFLKLLSSDAEAAGRRYTSLQTRLTGFFRMKGTSDPMSAADETIDRAVAKIAAGAEVPDVDNYCFGIARNIIKERFRLLNRENSAFEEFAAALSRSSTDQVERIYSVLQPCFEQLEADDQEMLAAYCQDVRGRARAEHRRQLAEAMKITVLALRIRVTRLRNGLADCARKMALQG